MNTTFGCCNGDDNGAPAGIVGVGLNMMGGNLTVLALSHLGPEKPAGLRGFINPRPACRSATTPTAICATTTTSSLTWKATDALTLTTEANWIRDDFDGFFTKGTPSAANAFGVAQYLSYNLSDTVTFNARAEVYRDDNGFFVTAFPNNIGLMNNNFVGGELGLPAVDCPRHRWCRNHLRRDHDRLDLQAGPAGADHRPADPAGTAR